MATQNIFGSAIQRIFGTPAQQTSPQQPGITNNLNNNPAPQSGPATQQTAPNGTIPPEDPNAKKESPDDKFAKIWDTEPEDPNKKPNSGDVGLTPEQMLEAASKIDFAKVIDKDTLAKITAGGEDAAAAFAEALNKVSQRTYAQTVLVTDKLIAEQVKKATENFSSKVPDMVRRQRVADDLVKDNPAFKDPAVAPVVGLIQNQLAEKFPNATSDELAEMAREYFANSAQKFGPKPKTESTTKVEDDEDWETWLTKDAKSR